jgi:hypothetical protein
MQYTLVNTMLLWKKKVCRIVYHPKITVQVKRRKLSLSSGAATMGETGWSWIQANRATQTGHRSRGTMCVAEELGWMYHNSEGWRHCVG